MKNLDKNILSLKFKGSNFLRQRLVLSVLTGKPIVISQIRAMDNEPGLREYEVNLLRLLDKLTNGTVLELSETGTSLSFSPGTLIGGTVSHACCPLRGIGYYLEVAFCLAPFTKKPMDLTLTGVTNHQSDVSVDTYKAAGLSLLKMFIVVDPGIELSVKKRGSAPQGGGEIHFKCPLLKLKPIQKAEFGKVKRVRGVAYATRVSPALANRFVSAAKGLLLTFLPDVFITADHRKGASAGLSPGFGGVLIAETTTGVVLTGDAVSECGSVAEDLGALAASRLLDEIYRGGLVDSALQAVAMLYMAMGQKDVTSIVTGPLSPYSIEMLRHIRQFLGLVFTVEPWRDPAADEEQHSLGSSKVSLTCVGIGYNKLT